MEEDVPVWSKRLVRSRTLGWPEGEDLEAAAAALAPSPGFGAVRTVGRGGLRVVEGKGGCRGVVPSPFDRNEGRATAEAEAMGRISGWASKCKAR
jgi:hypothetical protein